jgi:hypothetical protein
MYLNLFQAHAESLREDASTLNGYNAQDLWSRTLKRLRYYNEQFFERLSIFLHCRSDAIRAARVVDRHDKTVCEGFTHKTMEASALS